MAITPVSLFSDEWTTLNSIQSANSASSAERADKKASSSQGTAFDTFLNAAVDMYKEADSLQKSAESAACHQLQFDTYSVLRSGAWCRSEGDTESI